MGGFPPCTLFEGLSGGSVRLDGYTLAFECKKEHRARLVRFVGVCSPSKVAEDESAGGGALAVTVLSGEKERRICSCFVCVETSRHASAGVSGRRTRGTNGQRALLAIPPWKPGNEAVYCSPSVHASRT